MSWTEDRVNMLLRLREEGKTSSQIAEALGDTTRNAVIGKIFRLGLAKPTKKNLPRIRLRIDVRTEGIQRKRGREQPARRTTRRRILPGAIRPPNLILRDPSKTRPTSWAWTKR